jgi:MoaA/NifB/PqqE/SkfB family radical SAM enzyme
MENIYSWPLWHWHFELTSACTLKCPRCSRTELPESLVIDNLSLEFFETNFPATIVNQMQRVSFCGYDGDPIYNKQFIEICQYFKQIKPEIELYIVTNGSYKTAQWWEDLSSVLNEYDQIHFSIDGHNHESNTQYRVNSDWQSIMLGVATVACTNVRMIWDLIYFDFNYQHIATIKQMARDLCFDGMRITKSNKFGYFYPALGTDLQPPVEYMSETGRFESETIRFTDRIIHNKSFLNAVDLYQHYEDNEDIIPLCKIGTKGLFVDSQGYFYPCCWIVNRYDHANYTQWLTDDKNIKQSGLHSVLNNPFWETFIEQINSHAICNLKCGKNQVNKDTITRW